MMQELKFREPKKPIYATIPHDGKSYTVTFEAVKNENSIVTGSAYGYGDLPIEEYGNIPVIDFRNATNDQLLKALKLKEDIRPQEAQPGYYKGTLETFLNAIREIGISVI